MKARITQLSELVDMEDPKHVMEEVKKIVFLMFPQSDTEALDRAFADLLQLFGGNYPGYQACDTLYHNLKHTTDTFLAMARIIHGAVAGGCHSFLERSVALGLITALFHDSGYLSADDEEGPGAKYTLTHIRRSIAFMETYFSENGFSKDDFHFGRNILNCTGLDVRIDSIQFGSQENETLGKMLGTADLLGQMADRTYLEKLPLLYDEFRIANVRGIGSELKFFMDTPGFFHMTRSRFQEELGGVNQYMRHHFRVRWGLDADLYMSAIEDSMAYLLHILKHDPYNCRKQLRRSGVIRNLSRIRGCAF